ncbi:MAG: hypothetical protein K2J38_00440, partial [Muribaculaceae bacterium]|nr:hypothetical protein [Muribaculaceae bacterium]
ISPTSIIVDSMQPLLIAHNFDAVALSQIQMNLDLARLIRIFAPQNKTTRKKYTDIWHYNAVSLDFPT